MPTPIMPGCVPPTTSRYSNPSLESLRNDLLNDVDRGILSGARAEQIWEDAKRDDKARMSAQRQNVHISGYGFYPTSNESQSQIKVASSASKGIASNKLLLLLEDD